MMIARVGSVQAAVVVQMDNAEYLGTCIEEDSDSLKVSYRVESYRIVSCCIQSRKPLGRRASLATVYLVSSGRALL